MISQSLRPSNPASVQNFSPERKVQGSETLSMIDAATREEVLFDQIGTTQFKLSSEQKKQQRSSD